MNFERSRVFEGGKKRNDLERAVGSEENTHLSPSPGSEALGM